MTHWIKYNFVHILKITGALENIYEDLKEVQNEFEELSKFIFKTLLLTYRNILYDCILILILIL